MTKHRIPRSTIKDITKTDGVLLTMVHAAVEEIVDQLFLRDLIALKYAPGVDDVEIDKDIAEQVYERYHREKMMAGIDPRKDNWIVYDPQNAKYVVHIPRDALMHAMRLMRQRGMAFRKVEDDTDTQTH